MEKERVSSSHTLQRTLDFPDDVYILHTVLSSHTDSYYRFYYTLIEQDEIRKNKLLVEGTEYGPNHSFPPGQLWLLCSVYVFNSLCQSSFLLNLL